MSIIDDKSTHVIQFFNNAYQATEDLFKKLRNGNSIQMFVDRLMEMDATRFQLLSSSMMRLMNYKEIVGCNNVENLESLEHHNKFVFEALCHKPIVSISVKHILVGLYFPNAKVGDTIKIYTPYDRGYFKTEIHITEIQSIYKPILNKYWFYGNGNGGEQYRNVHITSEKPFYAINIIPNITTHCFLRQVNTMVETRDGNFYLFEMTGDNANYIKLNYNEIYAANVIKRAWRTKTELKKIHKKVWEKVCGEIRALPDIGIDYVHAKERFSQFKV